MALLKVLTIFGTRPEAIKMAPVIRQLKSRPERFDVQVCVTAQHREMLDQVLQLFNIQPDIDLNIMKPNQSLADLTSAIFSRLDVVVRDFRPDWVLAQGDTTTVMVAALLAFYNRSRFGHVEAGLRTGDKWQPFPEEINRKVAGVVADLHFAPTEWSKKNLLLENVPASNILVTGNPVIDALQWVAKQPYLDSELEKIGLPKNVLDGKRRIVLITAHRRENFGEPLNEVFSAIQELAEIYKDDMYFIYPVHMNPNVSEPAHRLLGNIPNVILLPPLDYLPLVHILKRSALVLTDSGGLQEEAPGLGVPVLVLRDVTERPEGVDAGTVRLVGTDRQKIISTASLLLNDFGEHQKMARAVNPYGDGHASERIVLALDEIG
ncbi:MAG: UDP-N-acetylglucosamine 2-epimerase (non-hydrolyzing) [Anaerolineales bacterium]|uniref:non-hydrolyzing UDP-N-acetylglucosamine 2-epimerase n=1 Tax=Candidatus Villigracilis proximus TaxID=3140683 RepID=UPI003134A1D6|nr:UDP-N-acetylglucosamine 2-epimerase (non-hydrolyzing) [Anaerolineales bacterium]